jgi:hypothetical protein
MPWCLDWIRTSSLRRDGGWEHEDKKNRNQKAKASKGAQG